jgi:gag-polypeptide of LTR copia-type
MSTQGNMSPPKLKNPSQFVVWWALFKQFGTLKGFGAALKGTAEATLPLENEVTTDQDKLDARKRNDDARAYITLSMPESLVLSVMEAGEADAQFPSGKACLMVAYLLKKFQNDSTMCAVNAQEDLKECTMKKDDHPDVLFDALAAVKAKYKGIARANVTEDTMVTQVITALPDRYSSVVTQAVSEARIAGKNLTLADLQLHLGTHYSVTTKGKPKERAREIEGGLAAVQAGKVAMDEAQLQQLIEKTIRGMEGVAINTASVSSGGGNGSNVPGVTELLLAMLNQQQKQSAPRNAGTELMCYNCGEKGHRAQGCPNKADPDAVAQTMRSLGVDPCQSCGRWGHSVTKCWNNPSNAHLRPEGWRGPYYLSGYPKTGGGAEAANVSIDHRRSAAVTYLLKMEIEHLLLQLP